MIRIETDNAILAEQLIKRYQAGELLHLHGQAFRPLSSAIAFDGAFRSVTVELQDVQVKPWDGEGQPPIGIEVEALIYTAQGGQEWVKATTIHHWRDSTAIAHGPDRGALAWPAGIRPIKTAEQLKAEEREKGIAALRKVMGNPNTWMTAAIRLYEAGARVES